MKKEQRIRVERLLNKNEGSRTVITEERISTFINSFGTGNTPFLNELEKYAIKTNVPVIRPQMQSF